MDIPANEDAFGLGEFFTRMFSEDGVLRYTSMYRRHRHRICPLLEQIAGYNMSTDPAIREIQFGVARAPFYYDRFILRKLYPLSEEDRADWLRHMIEIVGYPHATPQENETEENMCKILRHLGWWVHQDDESRDAFEKCVQESYLEYEAGTVWCPLPAPEWFDVGAESASTWQHGEMRYALGDIDEALAPGGRIDDALQVVEDMDADDVEGNV